MNQMMSSGHQKRHGNCPIPCGMGRKKSSMSVNGSENASVTKLKEKFPKCAVSCFSYTRRTARKRALKSASESHMSGRRESNSVYVLPKHAYYRYTTPRIEKSSTKKEKAPRRRALSSRPVHRRTIFHVRPQRMHSITVVITRNVSG